MSQLEARAEAYGEQAIIYGECTTSTEAGRIHREVHIRGTGSAPWFRCPHCRRHVALERESFGGWQDAPDVLAARASAYFTCPNCSQRWAEEDRRIALLDAILVARGQEVNAAGDLVGDPPATNTFGFRWTALASSLRTMADVAEREWNAETSGIDTDKRGVMQFVWALPYAGELQDLTRIEQRQVLEKIVGHERGAIPPETEALTLGIDIGSYICWWVLVAWKKDAQGHVVDFGAIDVAQPANGEKNPLAILAALRAFRDNIVEPGWGGRQPDRILVDSGYEQDVIYAFVRESGQPRYLACKGFGATKRRNGPWRRITTPTATRVPGNEWVVTAQPNGVGLVEVHADYWKSRVHDGFLAPQGAPGSLTLFRRPATDFSMKMFARQICAEYREVDPTPNTEFGYRWVVASRQNHYLDGISYARCAADMLGIRAVTISRAPTKNSAAVVRNSNRNIRTRY